MFTAVNLDLVKVSDFLAHTATLSPLVNLVR